jgi:hypothetical protein
MTMIDYRWHDGYFYRVDSDTGSWWRAVGSDGSEVRYTMPTGFIWCGCNSPLQTAKTLKIVCDSPIRKFVVEVPGLYAWRQTDLLGGAWVFGNKVVGDIVGGPNSHGCGPIHCTVTE